MSATPDWTGQVYKDTGTGNIWRANSTTPGDWVLELQNARMIWEPPSIDLPSMIGYMAWGNFPGITKLTFLATTSLAGFDLNYLSDITELHFPNLVAIDIGSTQAGYFACTNSSVATIDVSHLTSVAGSFAVNYCPNVTALDLSSLQSIGQSLACHHNSALTSIAIGSLTSLGVDANVASCALDASTIETILNRLVAMGGSYAGHAVYLDGGTNAGLASLSAQGQADYATLALTNFVSINP